MMGDTAEQLFEAWKKQLDDGARTWARLVSQVPGAAPDPTTFWRPAVEGWVQVWSRALAQGPLTPDVVVQWKQLVDQSIEAWSRALGDAMNSEAFAQMLGRQLDQWLTAYGPAKRAMDQSVDSALQTLNLASRSQLTSVAKQLVDLDERVERLEDGVSAVLKRLDELGRATEGPTGSSRREPK
jgi:hypothetical protein